MNQILLGISFPFALALIIFIFRGFRASFFMLIITPVLMFLSATWAILPDIPRLLGFTDLYYDLHKDPRSNIFYWHYTIDLNEHYSRWHPVLFVLIAAAIMFAAWRELYMAERKK